MKKLSKLALLISAGFSSCVYAQSINGVVSSADGKPIANAIIEIHGLNIQTTSNQNGRFAFENIDSGNLELHIRATGFAHLHNDINIPENGLSDINFVLKRSPIEVIDIVSTPLHMSAMESSMPVSVVSGEELRRVQRATLGDTLEKLPGVHSNFHAKVASTPVIRGLSGPRVLITQNGLDVSDVSRVGPDHSVASEASTAQQIEVLRGPATLFYGSGAIGGVVNVVDNRVPVNSDTRGEFLLESRSVDNQKLGTFNVTTGTQNFAIYADGYYRDSDDYEVPVMPEIEQEHKAGHEHEDEYLGDYVVENSNEESYGFTLGGSYLFEQGFIGISAEQFKREYGIPGHSHGDEEHDSHDGDEHESEHDENEHEENEGHTHSDNIFADLEQTRIQILGEYNLDDGFINQIKLRAGYTDYEHAEIEADIAGTTFKNNTHELRVDALHKTINDWRGGISFHYKKSDVEAQGSEAFTPPSSTETIALGVLEERHFGDVLVQLGARVERITMLANDIPLPNIDAHSHDADTQHMLEDGEEHEHDHEDSISHVFSFDHDFTPVSLSAGVVWDFTPGYNVGLSVSRSERAPSASELLSFGPHIGTRTFEVGALFALTENDEDTAIDLTSQEVNLETANNIDLSFRKTEGDLGFIFNIFYNSVNHYYYQINTGLFADDGHDHEAHDSHEHDNHEHDEHNHSSEDEEHDHSGELPVFLFTSDDVVLHGFEALIAWQVSSEFKTTFFADSVRARLKDGGDLPRTPPLRFGTQLSYMTQNINAHIDITRYQSQNRIADFETSTDGYTLVDASISYDLPILDNNISLYLKGQNLTDTEARVHTSFLKNIAPRPGRNFSIGMKGYF